MNNLTIMDIAREASDRFGKERILVSVANVDFVFKHQEENYAWRNVK